MSGGLVETLVGAFGDTYGLHVIACYVVTVGGILALGWWIAGANGRARRELDGLDRERGR